MRGLRGALFGLALALAGCGGPDRPQIAMALDTTQLALDAGIRSVRLSLFPGDQSCDIITFSGPRVQGVYQRGLDVSADETDTYAELFDIVPGVYTPAVWAFDENLNPVAFGCLEQPIEIESGIHTEIEIVLSPL